jgi:tRNA 2-thiouridine synthesizing protein A
VDVAAVLVAGVENCGRLIRLVAGAMLPLQAGHRLRVVASDPSALVDIPAWCRMRGHRLAAQTDRDGHFEFVIEKGGLDHGTRDGAQHPR